MKKGDLVLFYHSVSEKQAVGLARVDREPQTWEKAFTAPDTAHTAALHRQPSSSSTASASAATTCRTCLADMQYGGINAITLPMGRVSTPRRAIASQTRMPACSRK